MNAPPPPLLTIDIPPPPSVKPAIFITILTLATAIILTASLYLLLRYLHYRTTTATTTNNHHNLHRVSPSEKSPNFNSLPIFTFNSVTTATSSTSDCAVCLSKFEPNDLLRLLPLCRHVFHVDCIDIWLNGNITCPLCRSPVFNDLTSNSIASSRSFRVEIGSISRRDNNSDDVEETRSRSYSISSSFDYVINDVISEVNVGSFRWPEIKVEDEDMEHTAALSSEVGESGCSGGGGGWLKEFLTRSISSSRTASFRGSARWIFTGSSRRSGTELVNRDLESDLEASRLGEEIGELFRWLSTV